jgi:hypothetical protein
MIILGTNSIKDSGYTVDNSVRFNKADAPALKRNSMGTATNRKKWTLSMWVKRSTTAQAMLASFDGAKSYFQFQSGGQLEVNDVPVSTFNYRLVTNAVYRDLSAWMHIVIAYDSTQGTDSNRLKLYVNGEQPSLGTATYPSSDFEPEVNSTGSHKYGSYDDSTDFAFDGYFAEIVFIDGTQYAASDFGEFDEDSGIWKPIDVSGLTFGTNGHYLDFESSGNLGNDANGGTDFTANNLTAVDQSTDTCTNNFATMNPLDVPASNQPTFSEGNLKVTSPSAAGTANFGGASTFAVSSGKWYVEAKATVGAGGYSRNRIGITGNESTARLNNSLGANSYEYFYDSEAGNSNAGSYGNSYTTGDIIGIALNLDDNELKFYKNGTVQNSGTAISITASSSTSIGGYKITQGDSSGVSGATSTFEFNFGNPSFTISSGNADGNGYGNMEFEIPSGYFCLNSKNLAEYG